MLYVRFFCTFVYTAASTANSSHFYSRRRCSWRVQPIWFVNDGKSCSFRVDFVLLLFSSSFSMLSHFIPRVSLSLLLVTMFTLIDWRSIGRYMHKAWISIGEWWYRSRHRFSLYVNKTRLRRSGTEMSCNRKRDVCVLFFRDCFMQNQARSQVSLLLTIYSLYVDATCNWFIYSLFYFISLCYSLSPRAGSIRFDMFRFGLHLAGMIY